MLPKDVIVIDDFYDSPEHVRDLALNADYHIFEQEQNFPGSESKKSFYSDAHVKKFEEILNRPIQIDPSKYIFGKFRYSTSHDSSRTCVHLDWDIDWTGIIYLSLDKDCKGGLGLFCHRKTGLAKVPSSIEELKEYDCRSLMEFDRKYIMPVSKDLDQWDLMHEIPIKFNRLILFKGSQYFHGIINQFGNSIEDSRLTQNFFFNEARLKGEKYD